MSTCTQFEPKPDSEDGVYNPKAVNCGMCRNWDGTVCRLEWFLKRVSILSNALRIRV